MAARKEPVLPPCGDAKETQCAWAVQPYGPQRCASCDAIRYWDHKTYDWCFRIGVSTEER